MAIKDYPEEVNYHEIHHARLYPNLDTLVDKALIDKGTIDERTNFYKLTSRGRLRITVRKDWEDQFVDI